MIKLLKHFGYAVLGVLAMVSAPLFLVGMCVFVIYMLGVSTYRLGRSLFDPDYQDSQIHPFD